MRTIRLPSPRPARRLEIRGPSGRRSTRSAEGARKAFQRAVLTAAREERDEAGWGGWALWRGGVAGTDHNAIVAWVWPEDDEGGTRSTEVLERVLGEAGFVVLTAALPTQPRLEFSPQPLLARPGEEMLGQLVYPQLDYQVDPGVESITIEREAHRSVQPCPHRAAEVSPLLAIRGEPTRESQLLIDLGEASALGCCSFGERGDVVCPSCGRLFLSTERQ